MQVGSNATAQIKFKKDDVEVNINGTKTNFRSKDDWRGGLLQALNSVSGLTASWGTGADAGRLVLTGTDRSR